MTEQPRGHMSADGTYHAGKWTKTQLGAPLQTVLGDPFDRPGGTFKHPNPSRTAQHCVEFWWNVEVPDSAADMLIGYFRDRETRTRGDVNWPSVQAMIDEHILTEPNPDPYVFTHAIRKLARIYDLFPKMGFVDPQDAVTLVRVARMYHHAPDANRFPEEHEQVMQMGVALATDDVVGRTHTVRELEEFYGLDELHWVLNLDPEDQRAQQLDQRMAQIEAATRGTKEAIGNLAAAERVNAAHVASSIGSLGSQLRPTVEHAERVNLAAKQREWDKEFEPYRNNK